MTPTTGADVTWGGSERAISRRELLAGAGAVAAAGLAGCADLLGRFFLDQGDVHVVNGTDDTIHGSIEVTDPDDETVLSESFEIESAENYSTPTPDDGDGGVNSNQNYAAYEEVWEDPDTYEAAVELEEGSAVDGTSSATESVSVSDPDEETLAIFVGTEEYEGAIHFTVVEDFSDLREEYESPSTE